MRYRVICPECGWMGGIEESHVLVDGDIVHQCPVCNKRTYHFNATDAAKLLHDSCDDSGWFSTTDADGCSLCWEAAGMKKTDYYAMTIPEGWTDTTKQKCSTRQRGIEAEREADDFVVSVSTRNTLLVSKISNRVGCGIRLKTNSVLM